jgi:hypothetical protein
MQTEGFQNLFQWVKQFYNKEAAYNNGKTEGQYSCTSQTNTLRELNWNEIAKKRMLASTAVNVWFHDQSARQLSVSYSLATWL